MRARLVVLAVSVLLAARPAGAQPLGGERAVWEALRSASVVVDPPGCGGALAESPQLVVTARHCVKDEGATLRVRFGPRWTRRAWVVATDERADQVVLLLEDPVPVEPLAIVHRPQIPGTVLYFIGNPTKPRFEEARLEKIGRCPSLPDLPNAIFTTIDGVPGDSGSPVVDGAGRIVGLVHGGARCHILTPANTLARLVDGLLEREPARL